METAVIITISTVLIILALTVASRVFVPKALSEEGHDEEQHDEHPA